MSEKTNKIPKKSLLFLAVLLVGVLVFYLAAQKQDSRQKTVPEEYSNLIRDGYILSINVPSRDLTLFDTEGTTLRTWRLKRGIWRTSRITPEGRIFALWSYRQESSISEFSLTGEILNTIGGSQFHHDFFVNDAGNIITLDKASSNNRDIHPLPLEINSIVEVDRKLNKIIDRIPLEEQIEALEKLTDLKFPVVFDNFWPQNTPSWQYYNYIWEQRVKGQKNLFDWAHCNKISALPENPFAAQDFRFRAGNYLFSCRFLDLIAIMDKQSKKIVWAYGPGVLEGPHDVEMIEGGIIKVYDNGFYRGKTRIVEMNPLDKKILWSYEGSVGEEFFSSSRGNASRINNWGYFISLPSQGKGRFITRAGDLVKEVFLINNDHLKHYKKKIKTEHFSKDRDMLERAHFYSQAQIGKYFVDKTRKIIFIDN